MRYLVLLSVFVSSIAACGANEANDQQTTAETAASVDPVSAEDQSPTSEPPTSAPPTSEAPRPETPPAVAAAPLPATMEPAPHPARPEDAVDGATIAVSASNVSQTPMILGATPAPSFSAMVGSHGRLTVELAGFSYYCQPTPTFDAKREGRTIILTVARPDAVTRCMAVHSMRLDLGTPDMSAWLTEIVFRNGDTEVTRIPVVRSR